MYRWPGPVPGPGLRGSAPHVACRLAPRCAGNRRRDVDHLFTDFPSTDVLSAVAGPVPGLYPCSAAPSRRATWSQSCSKARAGALAGANPGTGNRRRPIISTCVA